jgi:hypothetical protein
MKFIHRRSSFHGLSDDSLSHLAGEVSRVGSRVGRTLKIVALVGGAMAIIVVTFVAVAIWQVMTSSEVRMIAGAAKDSAHAVALETATVAKCDRLIAEARAKGQFLPACASNLPAKPSSSDAAMEALVRAAIN